MTEIQGNQNEIHLRFVKGILKGMNPSQLHAYVTEGNEIVQRRAA